MTSRSPRGSFADFVLDQLSGLGAVECRAMFGGFGFYYRGVFFGIIYKDRLYFRTDATSRDAYTSRGMSRFRPRARQTLGSYYEVPAEIVEDRAQLAEWARAAVASGKTKTSTRAPRIKRATR